jgi:DNA uptake protein ComE-like DNA-binding protein
MYNRYSNYKIDSLKLDSLIDIYEKNLKHTRSEKQQVTAILDSLFPFNPNTVSFEQMILLGFDSIIARRISKYRNNKGQFIIKKDLLKIYDFPKDLYKDIVDYILLPEMIPEKQQALPHTATMVKSIKTDNKIIHKRIDINVADTNQLIQLNGIGRILSKRIIKYRDLLGGYSNIDQLDDVYGLKGKSLEILKSAVYIDSLFTPEKIEINFSVWEEMVKHPYINSQLANDLLNLRSNKGYLNTIDQLRDIPYLNDSILRRIEPYIEF